MEQTTQVFLHNARSYAKHAVTIIDKLLNDEIPSRDFQIRALQEILLDLRSSIGEAQWTMRAIKE